MTRIWVLVALLGCMAAAAACGDDGPGTTDEERCCACVQANACGGESFSFGACVPDGYAGRVDLDIDAACVAAKCGDGCKGAQFQ